MGAWLNIGRIVEAVNRGAAEGLEEVGDTMAADAKRRAPVRKVFKEHPGYRRKFRRLSALEVSIATRRANAFYAQDEFRRRRAVAHIRNYATVASARRGSTNAAGASRAARLLGYERNGRFVGVGGTTRGRRGGFEPGASLNQKLSTRGRYEIRSGRAVHREITAAGHTRVQAGGALKASIGSEGVVQTEQGQSVTVSAAIRYAKFVEFPTIRTAAQPFLRPALYAMRPKFRATLAAAIRRSLAEG